MTWLKKEKKVLQCRTWFDWFRADEPRAPLLAAQGSCCNDSFIIKIKDQRAQTRHSSGVGGFSDDTGNNWREVSTIPASQKSATLRVWLYANTGCDCKLEKKGELKYRDRWCLPDNARHNLSVSKKKQQEKQEEVDLCITVVCNFFKKLKQKACVKQQIMCDYDDSLFTRGRLGSHLGRSPDWDGRTSVTNELDGTKRTTASSTTFLFSSPRGMTTLCFCLMF